MDVAVTHRHPPACPLQTHRFRYQHILHLTPTLPSHLARHLLVLLSDASPTRCDSLVQLNDSHRGLASRLQHVLSETTMIVLAARNCSRGIMVPISATSSHALQDMRLGHRRKQDLGLSGSGHQPQTHILLFLPMWRWMARILTQVCKFSHR